MKRLLLVLLPIGLFVFSCEDKDTTPTEVKLWGGSVFCRRNLYFGFF